MIPGASIKNHNLFYEPIIRGMEQYQINTPQRIAMFLANICHESGSFRYVREIASGEAYEGRKDLGNVQPGDGKRFKGRGLIQITGRTNYAAISKAFGVDFVAKPDLLETPEWAAKSACWWWFNRGLNKVADTGDFLKVVKMINGGTNGLQDREKHYARINQVLRDINKGQ